MRCLEKSRDRRYGTAAELADDVRRHLRREPIAARPPDKLYRLQKFVARNQLACASVAAIAAALAARHPRDGDMLFERAQAEYWIGFIARRRGDFSTAREWLTRYRESAVALVALEGRKFRAQRELTYGEHNLAVLEMDQDHLAAAQKGFLAERLTLSELLSAHPGDTALRYDLADSNSWLGHIAGADGRYADALEHYRAAATRLEELIALEPAVPLWNFRLTDNQKFRAYSLAALGRRSEAAAEFAKAQTVLDRLVQLDPRNRQWLLAALGARIQLATLRLAAGDSETVAPVVEETRTKLEALVTAEPTARVFAGRLAAAWLLEGRLRHATGRADALPAAERAILLGDQIIRESRADPWTLWEFSQTCLFAGRLEQAGNQPDAARARWARVITVLAPRAATSNEWRFLDPLAQAYLLSGQPDLARPLLERLHRFGYHPIDPLAAPLLGVAP